MFGDRNVLTCQEIDIKETESLLLLFIDFFHEWFVSLNVYR